METGKKYTKTPRIEVYIIYILELSQMDTKVSWHLVLRVWIWRLKVRTIHVAFTFSEGYILPKAHSRNPKNNTNWMVSNRFTFSKTDSCDSLNYPRPRLVSGARARRRATGSRARLWFGVILSTCFVWKCQLCYNLINIYNLYIYIYKSLKGDLKKFYWIGV